LQRHRQGTVAELESRLHSRANALDEPKFGSAMPGRVETLRVALETEEKGFWKRLEFRVCREIDTMPVFRRQRLWCDGFIPEAYLLQNSPRSITGTAWIAWDGNRQEQWRFRLFLPSSSSGSLHVTWSELVPQEGETGWLGVNATVKELELDLRQQTAARSSAS
jgi:hypothetical protein